MTGFDISTAQGIYLGGNQVQSLYLGSTKIWPSQHDYSQDYLTIEPLNSGYYTINYEITGSAGTLKQSQDDGVTWTSLNNNGDIITNSKVLLKGDITPRSSYGSAKFDIRKYNNEDVSVKVYGNPLSLLYEDNFINVTHHGVGYDFFQLFYHSYLSYTTSALVDASNLYLDFELSGYCFGSMFSWCTNLVNAPELPATTSAFACYYEMFNGCTSLLHAPSILPATTLTNNCYKKMFYNCSSLVNAPELPATTLAEECYWDMFRGCSSLVNAPELPAITLAKSCYTAMFAECSSLVNAPELPATTLLYSCYYYMFGRCTSLVNAPELPATTLAQDCYGAMFSDCTSLQYIKCLATDISASSCTYDWVQDVASSGTFVKNTSMQNWSTGVNGIPSGWTVIDAN